MNNTNQISTNFTAFIISAFTFITPILFIPGFASYYHLPKTITILIFAGILLGIQAINIIKQKQINFSLKASHLPILILIASYLLSTLIQAPNQTEAWIERSAGIIGLSIIYLIGGVTLNISHVNKITAAFISSVTVLGVINIAQQLGLIARLGFTGSDNGLWNPTGSPISLLILATLTLIISISAGIKTYHVIQRSLYFASAVLQGITITTTLSAILLNEQARVVNLPYLAGYSIAIDILKNPQSAILGMGPDNYLAAFAFFKPGFYNNYTDLWNVRFTTSSNELFHIFTTNGLLGATALTLIILYLLKNAYQHIRGQNLGLGLSALAIIAGILLFPANITTWTAIFFLLTLYTLHEGYTFNRSFHQSYLTIGTSILLTALIIFTGYNFTRYALADIYFRNALDAIQANNAKDAYDYQSKAYNTNPKRISHALAFSQTNLAIANGMARTAQESQTELTDEQKSQLVQLIQQSVRFANQAVLLNRQNVNAWENRAQIYRQLLNFAEGADRFTVESYANALRLDPKNPRLWVDYGGYLLSIKQVRAAQNAFQQAVSLKSNYANGHFNLASAYEQEQNYVGAYRHMQQVVSLVEAGSPDQTTANTKLQEYQGILEKQIEARNQQTAPNTTGELTTPSSAIQRPQEVPPVPLDGQNQNIQADDSLLPLPTPISEVSPTAQPTNNPTP